MTTATKDKTSVKYDARNALYAYVGAGQFMVDKARELPAIMTDRAGLQARIDRTYGDLVKRGERVVDSIRTSSYTKRAADQTKAARSQVKAAATSVRKAVDTTAEATKAAARKVS